MILDCDRPNLNAKTGSIRHMRQILFALAACLVILFVHQTSVSAEPRVGAFLQKIAPSAIFPGATRFGPVAGTPPTAPAFSGDRLLGYVFLNSDVVNSAGYSGKPISILIGLSLDGKIVGAKLVEHHEPIVLVGIPQSRIEHFIHDYVGVKYADIPSLMRKGPSTDIVSGATVTTMVIGDSITRSAIRVARSLRLGGAKPENNVATVKKTVNPKVLATESWKELLADGSVRRLGLSVGEINSAFVRSRNQEAIAHPEPGNPSDRFIDLYAGIVTVPAIGRSLLGDAGYKDLLGQLQPSQQAIIIAGRGRYSFKGSGYVRGGIFDRIDVVQGESTIRFRDRNQTRLGDLAAAGAPDFREISLFTVPSASKLDPTAPWRLQLLVQRAMGARDKAFLTFDLDYSLPAKYVTVQQLKPAASIADSDILAVPLWQRLWRAKVGEIGVIIVALLGLTAIFFFQDALVKRPVLYDRVRLAYLVFTLFWIGWYAQAQLSVVNVLTFLTALRTGFNWDFFLKDPLIFILWFAVAASVLFWNRGAFCGWLCPFGALQELANRVARLLHVPQVKIPFAVHQRLWVIKYIIFLVLFGLSLYSLSIAEEASEVEPFKTVIVLHFIRDWPFVVFAVALIIAGLFIERFFCRYLCPLGAALAIPARLRMFDWLRRYRECGNPCQRCANECPVEAIHPEGHINPNECIQCLHCQMLYHHDQKCPVMIQKRLKQERRVALSSPGALSEAAHKAAPSKESVKA